MNQIIKICLRQRFSSFFNRLQLKKQFKSVRSFSSTSGEEDGGRQEDQQHGQTFEEINENRRLEANRSIIVQVNSEKSFPELHLYCQQFGNIHMAHHYTVGNGECHYILLEFSEIDSAKDAIESSCYNEDIPGVPVQSPFLWFRTGGKKKLKHTSSQSKPELSSVDGIQSITESELKNLLHSADSMEQQIHILHKSACLNDLEVRLRFLAALQVENSIKGMFPFANARPFGSSVNGFGKMGCDLDLILRLDRERRSPNDSRLVFHTKENLTNGRNQVQRQMESIGDMLHLFLPGVSHVRRILQARVPIIKFHHDHLNLEVDLSMSNLTGVYMSELLHLFGQLDYRVRPLTFCLREWAKTSGLTNPSPGRWITNFSLTCLVIFFLQSLNNPILPSIDLLCKSAKPEDIRITEDGINCTFLRSHDRLQFKSSNTASLNDLLLKFFEFYSQFDFSNKAISLNMGKSILKPDHSAIYVVNPLEQVLNICKNISLEECERFRIEVRNSAWILESEIENHQQRLEEKSKAPWGLLKLFKSPEEATVRPNMFFKTRMVEVSELFEREDEAARSNRNENSILRKIEFQNSATKRHVDSIRSKAKTDLKQIRSNTLGAYKNSTRRS